MEEIKIIKHKNPIKIEGCGDIFYPSSNKKRDYIGDGWYTKFMEGFYENKPYYPLSAVSQNSWKALDRLEINYSNFKVEYECPYNAYIHFWCLPIYIFSDNIEYWVKRYKAPFSGMYLDREWMLEMNPAKTKDGLPLTKVQRTLLGPGYTIGTLVSDGENRLYDTLLALDNGDYLGAKVWMWFNK